MKKQKPIKIKKENQGKFRKETGTKEGHDIPEKKILSAMKFGSPAEKKRAVFAENSRSWNKG
jgi:hypothetical protein